MADKPELKDGAWKAIEAALEYHETKRQIAVAGARLRRLHMPIFRAQVAQCCSRDGQPVITYPGRIAQYDRN